MILVQPNTFANPQEYIASLSRKARKNYRAVVKRNPFTVYTELEYVPEMVEDFMKLWEQQLIRGERRQWAFGIDHVTALHQRGVLKLFGALDVERAFAGDMEGSVVALHFVENHNGYVECHPPMYDKEKYKGRSLAKFMWFHLMMWGVEHNIAFMDMGGGSEPNWREMVRNRAKYPNPAYKWVYVPKEVKDNPDKQPKYVVETDGENKWVREVD